jgi:hypothetical protein
MLFELAIQGGILLGQDRFRTTGALARRQRPSGALEGDILRHGGDGDRERARDNRLGDPLGDRTRNTFAEIGRVGSHPMSLLLALP